MRGWVRRQGVALACLVVLLAGAVGLTLATDWIGYRDAQPHRVTDAGQGEPVRLGGTGVELSSFTVVEGGTGDGDELELASDTDLVIATLRVEPGDDGAAGCVVKLVATTEAGETRWDEAGFDATSFRRAEGFAGYCDAELTSPYALQFAFVVPKGVADRAAVEFTESSLLPEALRLRP